MTSMKLLNRIFGIVQTALAGFLFLAMGSALLAQEQITIEGTSSVPPFQIPGHKLWVYTLESCQTATISFPIQEPGQKLYRYKTSIQDATPVGSAVLVGNRWQVSQPESDCAYYLYPTQGTYSYYWIIDYSKYDITPVQIRIAPSAEPCERIEVTLNPTLASLRAFSADGKEHSIDREISWEWTDKEFLPDQKGFETITQKMITSTLIDGKVMLPAPLIDTDVTLLGDRFSLALNKKVATPRSNRLNSLRVENHAFYQIDGKNESNAISASLSAPTTILARMYSNDPASQNHLWRVIEGNNYTPNAPIVMQQSGQEARFVFEKAGIYTLVPIATNSQGSCTSLGELQRVVIGESKLEVPNAFTPFSSPGVNDIFRVSHYSLVQFEGYILNEWGEELFRWSDPDQGWDGTFRGKQVAPGVYYYVISARGSDDKNYLLRGSVNIIGNRTDGGFSSTDEQP